MRYVMARLLRAFQNHANTSSAIAAQGRCRIPVLLLLALGSGSNAAAAEWVEWIADAEGGVYYDNNINRSAFDADERSDEVLYAIGNLGRFNQLGDQTRLSITADLEGQLYNTYDLLNSARGGVTAAIWHKFGVGPGVPWLRAHVAAAYLDVRDDIRSGGQYQGGLKLGKRFSPRFDGYLGYLYTKREGGEGNVVVPGIGTNVFDQTGNTFSLVGNFLMTERTLLSAGYAYFDGDLDSACTKANVPTVLASEDVKAITVDNVFGGCVYRLDSTVNIWSLDFSYALMKGHASANLGVQHRDGKATVLTYDSTIFRASFIYNY